VVKKDNNTHYNEWLLNAMNDIVWINHYVA